MIATDFNIAFWFTLATFTLVAAVLATVVLVNVIRLRNVRISWKTGKMGGYPLFSSLFLISALLVGSFAAYQGTVEEIIASALYGWLGFCWFTTSFFATKRFITDHGIVKNVNEPSQTVAWHQIRDFVEMDEKYYTNYIFIYVPDEVDEPHNLIRLELKVPHKEKESFQKLIYHKLGSRIRCYVKDDINVEQFK